MQIPTSAGMLANSVLPVTPTQGALLSQVGETAGSTSFAPIEDVSTIRLSREVPEQHPLPNFAPENSGRADLSPIKDAPVADKESSSETEGSRSEVTEQQDDAAQQDRTEREAGQQRHQEQQQQDLDIIRQLSQRDSVVRAHEQAHSSVGGQYAGSAQYSYQRGPDGVSYAVGGEVPIDVGAISGDPRATLEKMQIVQRAALAPADPSTQDRRVAALASQQANQARAEIVSNSRESSANTKEADNKAGLVSDVKPVVQTNTQASADIKSFQIFNDRIDKINEIILAVSQSDISNARGQLLDDVV
jgi:hypothetical protein